MIQMFFFDPLKILTDPKILSDPKNLTEFFQGLADIIEQNELHIWNQYENNYQTLWYQPFKGGSTVSP